MTPGRRPRSLSVRARLAVFMVGVVVLGWVGFALVLAPSMRGSFLHVQEQRLALHAELVAGEAERTVTAGIAELEAIAALPGIRQMAPDELVAEVDRLDHTSQFFLFFMALDAHGQVVARPSKPERVGADRSMREYFRLARDQRRSVVADVEVSTAGNLSLVVGTPILGLDGGFAGVLTGSFGLMDRNSALYRLITRTSATDWPVEVTLTGRGGRVIASTLLTRAIDPAGSSSPTSAGTRWLAASTSVPSTGWTVTARVPEPVVLAQVAAIDRRATWITLVLLVLVGLVGLAVADRFLRPLERLSRALTAYGRDGNSADVAVSGSGEVREALEAFNSMQRERARAALERERIAEQMMHAQKLQTVGTLAGGIAHDFNNLLTPILLGAERLARDPQVGGKSAHVAADIVSSAGLARDLIARILAFSRSAEARRVPVPIASVVEGAVRLVRVALPGHVSLETVLDDSVGAVLADVTQLHQVLLNLCRNATDAIGAERGTVTIELARSGPSTVDLVVSDTGAGMLPEVRARVFEPYFTTKPAGQGTGLGLSVVHGIVLSHDGRISIESAPGRGTSVRVTLPVSAAEPTTARVVAPRIPGGVERILIVDDDPMVANAEGRAIRELGYQVEVVTVPREAIAHVSAGERFALIVCDNNMPELDGVDVVAAIRARVPDQRFLILTGSLDEDLHARYAAHGVHALASKPLSFAVLAGAIRDALDAHRPSVSETASATSTPPTPG